MKTKVEISAETKKAIEEHLGGEFKTAGRKIYAAKVYIKKVINSGNNEHKLKEDNESLLRVLLDDNKFPYYMHLGTGRTATIYKQ